VSAKQFYDWQTSGGTEDVYRTYPERAVPADVHGILLRVACLEDIEGEDPGLAHIGVIPRKEPGADLL
jgi:hypothetical protein